MSNPDEPKESGEPNMNTATDPMENLLKRWGEDRRSRLPGVGPDPLNLAQIRALAEPGELGRADEQTLRRLADSPVSLAQWAALIRARRAKAVKAVPRVSFGLRRAASTGEAPDGVLTEEDLFYLDIQADPRTPGAAIVTVEVRAADLAAYEGKWVRLQDENNQTLLHGRIENGYCCDRVQGMDRFSVRHQFSVELAERDAPADD